MAISENNFLKLKKDFGKTSSWCIWDLAKPNEKPKAHTGDMFWVDKIDLQSINSEYVFVGLNWSDTHGVQSNEIPWKSFHSDYPYQNDFKLRFALAGTKYWGSYITDIIKNCSTRNAKVLKKALTDNEKKESIKLFEEELELI